MPPQNTDANCPFCSIASTTPPARDPQNTAGPVAPVYTVLSTPSVMAFLDIAPVSRGHLVLVPRKHEEMLTQYKSEEAAIIGFWLPIVSRGVMRGVFGGELGKKHEIEGKGWDIVNANGSAAGQTVPHTHFHIIPRPGGDLCNALNAEKRTASIIGSGGKLNEDDAKVLQKAIKDAIREEVDHLRQTGDIVDGRQVYEYWGNIEGRRGLWL